MRWHLTPEPGIGVTRTLTRFLWRPKCIGHELRWLERATWLERRCMGRRGDYWWAEAWMDSTEETRNAG